MSGAAANMAATDAADVPFTVPVTDRLTYHFLIAVDIEGYSKLSTAQQKQVQLDLHEVLESAAAAAGLDRRAWLRQVGGDGEMAILPPDTDGLLVLSRGDHRQGRLVPRAHPPEASLTVRASRASRRGGRRRGAR
ncbi:hypothetical protein AB0C87_31265 [Actinomadura sp. NPDC048021]|uniref:hypothetical protein n=1 Tax=Actinomadura sp. NPDC048021 TaxID=3155385 RepID=UPI0034114D03